jgi:hypothetical protein
VYKSIYCTRARERATSSAPTYVKGFRRHQQRNPPQVEEAAWSWASNKEKRATCQIRSSNSPSATVWFCCADQPQPQARGRGAGFVIAQRETGTTTFVNDRRESLACSFITHCLRAHPPTSGRACNKARARGRVVDGDEAVEGRRSVFVARGVKLGGRAPCACLTIKVVPAPPTCPPLPFSAAS